MLDGLRVRRAAQCEMASLEPVIDRGINKAGFGEMVRHDFRLARDDVGKPSFECARNLSVQLMSAALEQTFVGRIPHQRVLEAVDRFGRLATAEYQLRLFEL